MAKGHKVAVHSATIRGELYYRKRSKSPSFLNSMPSSASRGASGSLSRKPNNRLSENRAIDSRPVALNLPAIPREEPWLDQLRRGRRRDDARLHPRDQ